jgi:cold shock CspA family protein/ribosome-associated translation inhibitor RaiA
MEQENPMEVPVNITCHNLDRSEWIEEDVRGYLAKLEEYYDRITSCHVVVEAPHRHHKHGNLYRVRLVLSVPHRELVVDHDRGDRPEHADLHVAIRDAFHALRRQLEDYAREVRGDVKTHLLPPHGRVTQIFPDEGYGFLEMPDGRSIYFHRNSVLNDAFGELELGSEVRFVEESGDKGPQASSVHVVKKHHPVVD